MKSRSADQRQSYCEGCERTDLPLQDAPHEPTEWCFQCIAAMPADIRTAYGFVIAV